MSMIYFLQYITEAMFPGIYYRSHTEMPTFKRLRTRKFSVHSLKQIYLENLKNSVDIICLIDSDQFSSLIDIISQNLVLKLLPSQINTNGFGQFTNNIERYIVRRCIFYCQTFSIPLDA